MKKNYSTFKKTLIILCFIFSGKGIFSQTVNVPYQFYLDANNNCNYDAGENLLYNIRGAVTFTYVNASSATVTVLDSVSGCVPFLSISSPQTPPVNGFSVSPTMSTNFSTFSVNTSCVAYSNLSYTTTNYLPLQSAGAINNIWAYTNTTGFYTASSTSSVFPVCNNLVNDSLNVYFTIDDIYTCAGFNTSRTYSLTLDANLLDVIVVNGGTGLNTVSSTSCIVKEYYFSPTTTIYFRTKLSNTGLTLGNHLFELKTTPLYTSTLSTVNYSCMINAVPCTTLTGNIYDDCDNNCIKNAGDGSLYYGGAVVKLFDAVSAYNLYPDASGNFSAFVPLSTSQYSVTSFPASSFYTPCPAASATTAVVSSTYDFGYKSVSLAVDPNISGAWVLGQTNPGSIKNISVYCFNFPLITSCISSFPVNPGKIKAVLDKNFTYLNVVGTTPIPNAIVPGPSGDTLIWNVANLNFTNSIVYVVSAQMATTVTIGTGYTNYAMVYPTTDSQLGNNFSVCTWTVGLPYDPNNKISWASGIQPNGDIPLSTTDLFYTINFQNVGTAPAINVKSLDTLDANLDWNTLQVISSSFPVQVQIDNVTGATFFNFNNINLPDSTSNEPGSHGFVHYRIKLKPSVPVNTVIKNRAHNYFDFMPAVATNQTKNKLVSVTGLNEMEKVNSVFVAPNPVSDKVTISSREIIQTVSLFNNLGQVVLKQEVNAVQSQMDLSQMTDGVYFIQIQFKDGLKTTRKVVKN